MTDNKRSEQAMLLLEAYEAEQQLEGLRVECDKFIDTLNSLRDWLRAAHREYSAFADETHLESRFALLHANVLKDAKEHRENLNFDHMLALVDKIAKTRTNLANIRDKRKSLGIPETGTV